MKSFVTALVTFLVPASVFASLVYMDTAELVEASDLIITGEVNRIESFYGADSFIYSRAYVTVGDIMLGDYESDVVEVVYPGGIVDGVGMATSISPALDDGMDVVLFLKASDEGEFVLTNHAASKFTVENGIVIEKGVSLADFAGEITEAVNR